MIVRKILETKSIRQVVTVRAADSIASATEVLAKHRIGAVVVSGEDAAIEGILSERDVVKALSSMGAASLTLKVRDLMTADVRSCAPDETAHSVLQRMTDGRFRHMPVVDGGRMVGVISIGDVVKARLMEMQEENAALTGMIANSW